MDQATYKTYVNILERELVPALGCTEPAAIAFAAAKVAAVLGQRPDYLDVACSGNIIKNVKGVAIPNAKGMKGMAAATALGALGGDASLELGVLQALSWSSADDASRFVAEGRCACHLAEGEEGLYIRVTAMAATKTATVEIRGKHTQIIRIEKDGNTIFEALPNMEEAGPDLTRLNVRDILQFAKTVALEDVRELLERQINLNTAISDEGLRTSYGVRMGRLLLDNYEQNIKVRARARAAAGSDARMSGCPLPVVINAGSGNQGITVSLPVIEYAAEYGANDALLYRALVVANLISLHQKRFIGNLTAYCGATNAACGAACGIAFLAGADYDEICRCIVNTICNIGGMVCDGAKASCAAKISSAVDAAINGYLMAREGISFGSGEGLVETDIEKTIQNLGRVGREGMRSTDLEILHIMLEN